MPESGKQRKMILLPCQADGRCHALRVAVFDRRLTSWLRADCFLCVSMNDTLIPYLLPLHFRIYFSKLLANGCKRTCIKVSMKSNTGIELKLSVPRRSTSIEVRSREGVKTENAFFPLPFSHIVVPPFYLSSIKWEEFLFFSLARSFCFSTCVQMWWEVATFVFSDSLPRAISVTCSLLP